MKGTLNNKICFLSFRQARLETGVWVEISYNAWRNLSFLFIEIEILAIDICCFSITMMKRRCICIKPRWNVLYITVQMWSALHLTQLLLLIRVKPGDWLSGLTTKTHHLSLQKYHLKHMPGYIWAIISTTLESVCPCLCLKGGDPQVMYYLQIFF